jgi:hypothetical protein
MKTAVLESGYLRCVELCKLSTIVSELRAALAVERGLTIDLPPLPRARPELIMNYGYAGPFELQSTPLLA